MPNLVTDTGGNYVPQHLLQDGSRFQETKGNSDGGQFVEVHKPLPGGYNTIGNVGLSAGYDNAADVLRTGKPYFFDKLMDFLKISPGQERAVIVPIEGLSKVFAMAKGTGPLEIYSQSSPDGGFLLDRETVVTGIAANNGVCRPINNLAPYTRLIIKNTGAVDANYHLWVYGL